MYEVARYENTNLRGTALLYDLLARLDSPGGAHRSGILAFDLRRGRISLCRARHAYPEPRSTHDKQAGHFDPLCPVCNGNCESIATPEFRRDAAIFLLRTYQAGTGTDGADVGQVWGFLDCLALSECLWSGQSLKNPYTGILAIFSTLARTKSSAVVFEDGQESRDFVYI